MLDPCRPYVFALKSREVLHFGTDPRDKNLGVRDTHTAAPAARSKAKPSLKLVVMKLSDSDLYLNVSK